MFERLQIHCSSRSGVGLFLSKNAQKALLGYSTVCDRIIVAKFKSIIGCLVIIHVYAPTTNASQQEVELFYSLLQAAFSEQKHSSCVVLMDDFNAKVGSDWEMLVGL